jgi:hypothetical protein
MADLIIKPTSGNLIIKDDQDVTRLTVATSTGATTLSNISSASTFPSGHVVQVQYTQTGAVDTTTNLIPYDDTIPQITEGKEFMTRSITPTNASNILKIEVVICCSAGGTGNGSNVALFRDSTANALAAIVDDAPTGVKMNAPNFRHYVVAGSTSATTFRVRAGCRDANTFTFNGSSSARKFGGVLASSITVTEIAA